MDYSLSLSNKRIYEFYQNNPTINFETVNLFLLELVEKIGYTKDTNKDVLNAIKDLSARISIFKPDLQEQSIFGILNKTFPMMEIIQSEECFIMKRENKQFILFENKISTVTLNEVKEFVGNIMEQRCNGILMSQSSGIVCKPDFFIEIHDGCVLVYLHNVEYSQEKIKVAVNIIEHLSSKLSEMDVKDGNSIDKDVLDNINKEYQVFLSQRAFIVETCKTFHKNVISQIDNLKMPDLGMYLGSKYASIQNQEFVCEECGSCFTKKASLASHKKSHKK